MLKLTVSLARSAGLSVFMLNLPGVILNEDYFQAEDKNYSIISRLTRPVMVHLRDSSFGAKLQLSGNSSKVVIV